MSKNMETYPPFEIRDQYILNDAERHVRMTVRLKVGAKRRAASRRLRQAPRQREQVCTTLWTFFQMARPERLQVREEPPYTI